MTDSNPESDGDPRRTRNYVDREVILRLLETGLYQAHQKVESGRIRDPEKPPIGSLPR